MKAKFNKNWIKSKQPRKQRKYNYNAPLHLRRKMMSAILSKELRKKYGRRNSPIRKGDSVKIVRGNYKDTIGDVEEVNIKKYRVNIKGAQHEKTEGQGTHYPIHPSNVIIIKLNTSDKTRKKTLNKNKTKAEKSPSKKTKKKEEKPKKAKPKKTKSKPKKKKESKK